MACVCRLEVRPDSGSSLEQRGPESQPPQADMLDLLEESTVTSRVRPQPFSQRRAMFSAGARDRVSAGEADEGCDVTLV